MTTTSLAGRPAQPRWCAGPLGAYLESFGVLLDARGYASATEQEKLQLIVTVAERRETRKFGPAGTHDLYDRVGLVSSEAELPHVRWSGLMAGL